MFEAPIAVILSGVGPLRFLWVQPTGLQTYEGREGEGNKYSDKLKILLASQGTSICAEGG